MDWSMTPCLPNFARLRGGASCFCNDFSLLLTKMYIGMEPSAQMEVQDSIQDTPVTVYRKRKEHPQGEASPGSLTHIPIKLHILYFLLISLSFCCVLSKKTQFGARDSNFLFFAFSRRLKLVSGGIFHLGSYFLLLE
jgi:hypothetical protein